MCSSSEDRSDQHCCEEFLLGGLPRTMPSASINAVSAYCGSPAARKDGVVGACEYLGAKMSGQQGSTLLYPFVVATNCSTQLKRRHAAARSELALRTKTYIHKTGSSFEANKRKTILEVKSLAIDARISMRAKVFPPTNNAEVDTFNAPPPKYSSQPESPRAKRRQRRSVYEPGGSERG